MGVNNKVFIGGLNYSTTEQTLMQELSKYGTVVAIRIVTDRETGRSKGFGFATFDSAESAKKAIEALDNTIFDGRRIGVKESIERK
jgi:cold-inducible RNA-binding protein